MSRLGDTIKAARLKAGMTPKALGKKCGMAESFINDVESGRKIVSDDQAQRILKVLGVKNPISTELEVAQEAPVELRPRPRPYVLPVQPKPTKEEVQETQAATDAWLDALGGVVKRVPIVGSDGVVIDHRLQPVIGGKIEGGHPDKVLYFRQEDDSMRGFRIYAGDLLLVIPTNKPEDERLMLVQHKGKRVVRKLLKLDGNRIQLQSFDYEFSADVVSPLEIQILGKCVKLQRTL